MYKQAILHYKFILKKSKKRAIRCAGAPRIRGETQNAAGRKGETGDIDERD
jgi:hypothetical protein